MQDASPSGMRRIPQNLLLSALLLLSACRADLGGIQIGFDVEPDLSGTATVELLNFAYLPDEKSDPPDPGKMREFYTEFPHSDEITRFTRLFAGSVFDMEITSATLENRRERATNIRYTGRFPHFPRVMLGFLMEDTPDFAIARNPERMVFTLWGNDSLIEEGSENTTITVRYAGLPVDLKARPDEKKIHFVLEAQP